MSSAQRLPVYFKYKTTHTDTHEMLLNMMLKRGRKVH